MVNANIKPSVQMLREVKLLQQFSDTELSQMIQLGNSQLHEIHSNIVIEGELSWGLYLIIDGIVGIFKTNKLTSDIYDIGQLRSGAYFGEMSLVDDQPRSATVRAVTDCHLFYISKDSFNQFLAESTDRRLRFYEYSIRDLIHRLRELDDNYVISQYQLWKTVISTNREAA